MLTQSIRNDPERLGGNYTTQPKNMQNHLLYYGLATIGGNQALYKQAPSYQKGDEWIAQRLAQPFTGDANDTLYQWESSADYDPSPGLEKITAMVLAINSADDERNPPELGVMQAWMWATKYPGFMDALVPMACLPTAMSGRNYLLRRMLTQSIRNDPEWLGGNYTAQPKNMQNHLLYYGLATIGGNQALHKQTPSYQKGNELIAQRLAQPFRGDANDTLYQWESSADYDPSAGLDRVAAAVLAINSSDDERNPPELGVMERELKRIRNARYLLIPGTPDTRGHGTTGMAKLWKQNLVELLQQAPRR